MNYCGACGKKLYPNAIFCPNCGKRLDYQTQNINVPPNPLLKPQAPFQQNMFSTPVKRKSKIVYLIPIIAFVIIVSLVLIFSVNFLFKKSLTGKIEYKPLNEDKIVSTSKYGTIVINEFCLVLKDEYDRKDAEKIADKINGKITGELEYLNLYQVELSTSSEDNLTKTLNEVRKSERTQYAFPNSILAQRDITNTACNPFEDDVYSGNNGFALKMLGIKEAWDIIKASGVELKEVSVGVVDAQVNTLNNELRGDANITLLDEKQNDKLESMKKEFDKANERGQDIYGRYQTHGNEVVNIIAANSKNGGITGVASILGKKLNVNVNDAFTLDDKEIEKFKDKDDFQVEKTLSEKGKKSTLKELANILEQVEKGSKIINCSFGAPIEKNSSEEEKQIFKNISNVTKGFLKKMYKEHPDVVFVGAAGNSNVACNGENDFWGQKLPNLITVGAVNSNGDKADYSHYSEGEGEVTISAFDNIMTKEKTKETGTSFTAPQVTGVIALMKSIDPSLSAEKIKEIIKRTSEKSYNGKPIPSNIGGGFIRADNAVLEVIEKVTGKKFDKRKLLSMNKLELNIKDNSPEFTVTASVEEVGGKGTSLQIECSGGEHSIGGNTVKEITSSGSVSWSLTVPKKDTKLSVKVTRLDTKACKTIFVGGDNMEKYYGTYKGELTDPPFSSGNAVEYNELTIKISSPDRINIVFSLKVVETDDKKNFVGLFKGTYDGIINKDLSFNVTGNYELDYNTYYFASKINDRKVRNVSSIAKGKIADNLLSGVIVDKDQLGSSFTYKVPVKKTN